MKPVASKFPEAIDSGDDLYLVADALKVPLGFDYYPGNTSIIADGDISKFPPSGIITLIDQCNTPKERAIYFYYSRRTNREFFDLELLSSSPNVPKPKKITLICSQVMADHREMLKNAILAIENCLGTRHEIGVEPKKGTIFERINFLTKVMFSPKAWFEANRTLGVSPFTTQFIFTGSGNIGPVGEVSYLWKFNEEEIETKEPQVEKVFLNSGKHTVSLTIKNSYGEDTVTFPNMIDVKEQAPQEATVKFLPLQNQIHFNDIFKIRTPINQPVAIEIPQKVENQKSFAGELIDPQTNKAVDAITSYTWSMADDLPHSNTVKTKALYTTGGTYDLVLKTNTKSGSYRITTYKDCIDVVEPLNLWVWTEKNKQIKSYEFGLISEVFKASNNTQVIDINDSFIENEHCKHEFWRNNGCAIKSEFKSGEGGDCLLFWASGRNKEDEITSEKINFLNHNGFADTYTNVQSLSRPWNWAALTSKQNIYFVFGLPQNEQPPTLSLTNNTKTTYNIISGSDSDENIEYRNFKNGAHELMTNPGVHDSDYNTPEGHFSSCRTTWKDDVGYLLRNSGLGEHFAYHNFYKTEGTIGMPFKNIVKLPDMPGDSKDGSLVALNAGIYFFGNYGNTCCFNDITGVWEMVNAHNQIAKKELDALFAV